MNTQDSNAALPVRDLNDRATLQAIPPAKRYSIHYAGFATPCWDWLGALASGYGVVYADGRQIGAHRFMYEHHVGPIPEGLHLDHLCRRPICVNPAHLEPVTRAENARRGRAAKLTRAQVEEIRSSDERPGVLAKRMGVTSDTVTKIRQGRDWADVGVVARGESHCTGERHHEARLTEDLVRDLRRRAREGESYTAMARELGVHPNTVRYACRRLTWKHVEDQP